MDNKEVKTKEADPSKTPLYVHPATLYCALKGCQDVQESASSIRKAAAFPTAKSAKKRGFCNPSDASYGGEKAVGCIAVSFSVCLQRFGIDVFYYGGEGFPLEVGDVLQSFIRPSFIREAFLSRTT